MSKRWTRRRFLAAGAGGVVLAAAGGGALFELVENGVLPGKYRLDALLGGCDVGVTNMSFGTPGPAINGTFYSRYRNRSIGYTLAFPPGHKSGDAVPLVVALHGYLGNHRDTLFGGSPGKAVALKFGGRPMRPMALVTVYGGNGYWNPHPGDDPFGMLIHELIPLCQSHSAGLPARGIGMFGISMGGYAALLVAEKQPAMIRAVAAISPAIWTSYGQARNANPGAYASASAFAANDVVAHTGALARVPVRVAIGQDDPFLPGVQALQPKLSGRDTVVISPGCHTGPFFDEQLLPSLVFLSRYLGTGRNRA